mmetsp:Transcript_11918/g.28943  ORF Transcript_11918/g.28943 Transcript_11918/m.28943 type:complete len:230 (-) Transcript_11918:493-1182(-)
MLQKLERRPPLRPHPTLGRAESQVAQRCFQPLLELFPWVWIVGTGREEAFDERGGRAGRLVLLGEVLHQLQARLPGVPKLLGISVLEAVRDPVENVRGLPHRVHRFHHREQRAPRRLIQQRHPFRRAPLLPPHLRNLSVELHGEVVRLEVRLPAEVEHRRVRVQRHIQRVDELRGPAIERVNDELRSTADRDLEVLSLVLCRVVPLAALLPAPVVPRRPRGGRPVPVGR